MPPLRAPSPRDSRAVEDHELAAEDSRAGDHGEEPRAAQMIDHVGEKPFRVPHHAQHVQRPQHEPCGDVEIEQQSRRRVKALQMRREGDDAGCHHHREIGRRQIREIGPGRPAQRPGGRRAGRAGGSVLTAVPRRRAGGAQGLAARLQILSRRQRVEAAAVFIAAALSRASWSQGWCPSNRLAGWARYALLLRLVFFMSSSSARETMVDEP